MNKEKLLEEIEELIVACQDDIQEYLMSDVPIESYASDIDSKLDTLKLDIRDLYNLHFNL